MAQSPYEISEEELRRSTGHAPGQPLTEMEPEAEVAHELPLRVTPMSPVTEIQALGQISGARLEAKGKARVASLVLLALIAIPLVMQLADLVR
jgi:hypothetical protein